MDTESELNLYNHLDPFTSTSDVVGKANTSRKELATKINQNQSKTNLQYSSKNKKKRNQKKVLFHNIFFYFTLANASGFFYLLEKLQ